MAAIDLPRIQRWRKYVLSSTLGAFVLTTACISDAWWPALQGTLGTITATAAEGQPADVLAAQIRKQGYPCDQPRSAVIDSRAADKIVWKLECKNATYRVQPIPGRAAIVEKIN